MLRPGRVRVGRGRVIRKGTRVVAVDPRTGAEFTGKVLGKVNWDRTYYKVQADDGTIVAGVERVRKAGA